MDLVLTAEGPARVLTVHRPHRKNALDLSTLRAFKAMARDLRRDKEARGVILTGSPEGGVFLSGGDLRALEGVRTARAARSLALDAHAAVDALLATGLPLLAAIHGDAFGGGCELAAACDLRVCEAQARFHWVQVRFGVTTGWGGAARLLELVPRGVALRWLLTGQPVEAREARDVGFVEVLCARGEALAEAVGLVRAIARSPRRSVARMLRLLRETPRLDRAGALGLELDLFGRGWASKEHRDAVAAFLRR
ncbi:MAG: enoyl-CoA hydratase/isomerase family protein [Deltaproteobacteria bacterium]|nr:enoyl-CoA hydratase/isomerase family protein [Deltaproteobacteria bacterium]